MPQAPFVKTLRRHPLAVAALLAIGALPAQSAPVDWTGPNASFWDIAANWSSGLPGAADDLALGIFDTEFRSGTVSVRSFTGSGRLRVSGGVLRTAVASSIGTLDLTGGTLSGKGTVTATTLNWSAGTMGEYEQNHFGGATTVTGLATISGAAGKQLYYGRVLNLNGGGTWSGAGAINMTDASAIGSPSQAIAPATINLVAGKTFDDQGSGTGGRNMLSGVFNNAGTYVKSAGADYTYVSSQFNNYGNLNVNAGSVRLAGGGNHSGGFTTLAGATLAFEGGTHNFNSNGFNNGGTLNFNGATAVLNGTISLGGNVIVSAGQVTSSASTTLSANTLSISGGVTRLQGTVPIGTLALSGGTLSGQGTVNVGGLGWTGGTMGEYDLANFGGVTNVAGLTSIGGGAGKQLYYGRVLNLNGGAVWAGAGAINMTDASAIGSPSQVIAPATINLVAGKTFDDQGSGTGGRNMLSGVFNNAGTYVKSAGADYTYISSQFNNYGNLNVNAGSVRLAGGGTQTGSFTTLAGTTLAFEGGTHSFASNAFSNAGTMNFNGATANFGGNIALNGNVIVSAGLVTSGASTTLTADKLELSGGVTRLQAAVPVGALTVSGGTLSGKGTVSAGTLAWSAGTMGEYDLANFGGTTNVAGTTAISGNAGKQLYYGRVLNLNGGGTWSGAGAINMTDASAIGSPSQVIAPATINLVAGKTFDDQGSGTGGRNMLSGVFNNAGTYVKSAGADYTYISSQFNNSGALNVNAGSVRLAGGGNHSGGFTTLAGATLAFEGGTHNFNSNSFNNGGTLNFNGATAVLNGTISLGGNVIVSAGQVTSSASTTLSANTLSISGGVTRLQGTVPIGTLALSGGTLSGQGTVNVGGLGWTGGTMGEYDLANFGGVTNVAGLTSIGGGAGKQLYYGRVLNLNGGAVWAGAGAINLTDASAIGSPSQVIAPSTINLVAGKTFDDQGSGTGGRNMLSGVFNNAGTYVKSAGADYTYISSQFNNYGNLNVNAGTVRLAGGGTQTGSFTTLAGTTLAFEGGTHSFASNAFSNAGTLNFNGATANLGGNIALNGNVIVSAGLVTSGASTTLTADKLELSGGVTRLQAAVPVGALTVSGGTLSGKGTVSAGTLAWSAGTMGEYDLANFGGTTNVAGTTAISGNAGKQLYYGRVLNLNGGGAWSGAGAINMTDASAIGSPSQAIAPATINLVAGKTFDDQGSGTGGRNMLSGVFNNAGTYVKSAGADYTYISSQFNNYGNLNVNAGSVRLAGGGTQTGSFTTLAGATLAFEGGTHNFNSNSFNNGGTLNFNGATAVLNGTISLGGNVIVSAGQVTSGASTTLSANTLSISGGVTRLQGTVPIGTLALSGGTLSGQGTVNVGGLGWTGGTMGEYDLANFGGVTNVAGLTSIGGGAGKQLYYGRVLNLNGGAVWAGAGAINLTDASAIGSPSQAIAPATINLAAGKTFDDQGSGTGGRNMLSGVFNNAGTYVKSAGADYTYVSSQFNNYGNLNVNAGTVRLAGGGTQTGSFTTLAGTTLAFEGGTHSFASNAFSNAGTLNFNGATATLGGNIALNGNVIVSAGLVTSGASTTLTAERLELSGGVTRLQAAVPIGALTVSGGTLSGKGTANVGTLAWSAGTMGEYELANFGGTTNVAGTTAISGNAGKQLYYGRVLNLNGGGTWSGAGAINMTDASAIGSPSQAIAPATINLAAGQTLEDQGGGFNRNMLSGVFNNAGTYQRTGLGTTNIGSVFNNAGKVQVDGGLLNFYAATSLQGSAGTLQIGSAGRVLLTGGNSTVGTLLNNGSATNALDLGTRTITVATDYDNANFGVGNAFNRRANVVTSGTGNRLIAGGTTNQALTGTGIVNGTTATPTLFLGAVHVGVNTIEYQIVNTGMTGPALRGAVQTVFAGGGLTDTRLSGTGATAGNWGPIAAGSALTRQVIFTVDQAGLQTAVTNQSVAIVNNFDNTLSQVLAISSTPGTAAYNLAAPNTITPNPIVLANQRVGGTAQSFLVLANTAAAGSFTEGLNASFGAVSGGAIANGGSFTLLGGGQSNGASLALRVDTATAGAKSGSAVVNLVSDGSGTSGLGQTALPSQTVAISGKVYRLAGASTLAPSSITLANQRVGGTLSQGLAFSNTAVADGFSERLNASFVVGATLGSATASGAFSGLAAGANDGSSLRIGVDTSSAGAKGGSATVALASDGAGTSGFAAAALGTQTVSISGNVYRLAAPVIAASLTLAARVGDAVPTRSIGVQNSSTDVYTERLNASLATVPAGFTGSGSITGLAASASSNALGLTLASTAVAGTTLGTASIALVSSGAGTTGAADAALASANVALTGRVYAPAVAQLNTAALNFGIVRVGDSVAGRAVSVSNTASAALTDTLRATATANAAPFVTGGVVGNLAAGATSANGLVVGLNTGTAGVFSSTATIGFTSQNADMADLALGSGSVALNAQINNIAQSTLAKASGGGSFSSAGLSYSLNFGTLQLGSSANAVLSLTNSASGTADALAGSFDLSALLPGDAFSVAGFGSFSGVNAGDTLNGLAVSFSGGAAGSFDRVLVLSRLSTNGSGPDLALANVQLHLSGTVVAVPEPGTYVLMLGGLLLLATVAKRRRA